MTDLLGCPFCGSKPSIETRDWSVTIYCSSRTCGCCAEAEGTGFDCTAEAWNRRSGQPQYLIPGCLRAGECHGQCNSEPCTNYGKIIVVRRCVEPKQDGIVYPRVNADE